jgi:hypothetical protein
VRPMNRPIAATRSGTELAGRHPLSSTAAALFSALPLHVKLGGAVTVIVPSLSVLLPSSRLPGHRIQLVSQGFDNSCRGLCVILFHPQAAPQGHPDCLTGKTFVVSGVLDSLTRGEAEDFIKRHGGKVWGHASLAAGLELAAGVTCVGTVPNRLVGRQLVCGS